MKKVLPLMIAGCLSAGGFANLAHSADLMTVYRDALAYDAQFASARAALDAGREKLPQGRAGLLPTVGLSANTTWNRQETDIRRTPPTSSSTEYNSNGWSVSLSQPLFRWQNWVAYTQSELAVAQAEAQFGLARQELIVRAAQADFDVLLAQDTLATAQAQKVAIAEQLESAKRNFEVGTATITDTHEAQARYDLTSAQEIAAMNDLSVKRQVLRSVIGKEPEGLKNLKPGVQLVRPQPDDIDKWVEMAESASASVQIYQALYEIAQREIEKQRAGHYPTLDLVASRSYSGNNGSLALGSNSPEAIPTFIPSACSCRSRFSPAARWFPRAVKRLP
jgi:outer membrane protein